MTEGVGFAASGTTRQPSAKRELVRPKAEQSRCVGWGLRADAPGLLQPCGLRNDGGCYIGVYQIGDVQARSWIVAGRPFGIGIPSATASYVLQRGVGISSTRA